MCYEAILLIVVATAYIIAVRGDSPLASEEAARTAALQLTWFHANISGRASRRVCSTRASGRTCALW